MGSGKSIIIKNYPMWNSFDSIPGSKYKTLFEEDTASILSENKRQQQLTAAQQQQQQQENELKLLSQIIKHKKKTLAPDDPEWPRIWACVGLYFADIGNYDYALRYLIKAYNIRRKSLPLDHADLAVSLKQIGTVLSRQGEYDTALKFLNQSGMILKRSLQVEDDEQSPMTQTYLLL